MAIQFDIGRKTSAVQFTADTGRSVTFSLGGERFVLTAPPSVEMRVEDGYIQFRSNDGDWENVIALDALKGPQGDKGDLSPATETVLGGILASDTVLVDENGRATAVVAEEDFATEEDVSDALVEIFGAPGETVTPSYIDGDTAIYGN